MIGKKLRNIISQIFILYVKNEKMYPAYASKHDSKHKKQTILLMIPLYCNGKTTSIIQRSNVKTQWR